MQVHALSKVPPYGRISYVFPSSLSVYAEHIGWLIGNRISPLCMISFYGLRVFDYGTCRLRFSSGLFTP